MTVNTLQFIHDSADDLDAVRQLYAHCLFYYSTDSVAVDHGREVVQTVGHGKGLRIRHALKHLLDAAVYVSEMWHDAFYGLTVEHCL